MRSLKTMLAMTACVLAAPALLGSGVARAQDDLVSMQKNPADWVMPAGNYNNQRYSTLSQINTRTAKDLRPVWTFSTGVLRGHEGGPLVIGDTMYMSTPYPNKVFALDLNNQGRILWTYEPKQDPTVIPVMCCDTVNRGVAYGDGKIIVHLADTSLVALDAKTGKVVWDTKTGNASVGETGTLGPARRQGQGLCRHQRWRVRHPRPHDGLRPRVRKVGLDRLQLWSRQGHADGPRAHDVHGQARWRRFLAQDLAGR